MASDVPTGFTLYAGPSRLDPGVPIICVATMSSNNAKTGDMVQTWIMLAYTTPTDAVRTGADHDLAFFFYGLSGIKQYVHENMVDLCGLAIHVRHG